MMNVDDYSEMIDLSYLSHLYSLEELDVEMKPIERLSALLSFQLRPMSVSDFFNLEAGEKVRIYWAVDGNIDDIALDATPMTVVEKGEGFIKTDGGFTWKEDLVPDGGWNDNEFATTRGKIFLFQV
jgi:hypothetical protein